MKRRGFINSNKGNLARLNLSCKYKWLVENPISNTDDINIVCKEVEKIIQMHQKCKVRDQWYGIVLYLRLIHCITDDKNIGKAFKLSFKTTTKSEID